MRSCMAAFTPETRSPSFFRTDFSCALIRVFTLAITAGVSWKGPCESISRNFDWEQPLLEQNLVVWERATQIEVIKFPDPARLISIVRNYCLWASQECVWKALDETQWLPGVCVSWSLLVKRCGTVLCLEAWLWGSSYLNINPYDKMRGPRSGLVCELTRC